MWILKFSLLLFLFGFSKQENISIQTHKNVENQTVTLWCNVSFNDQEFTSRMQWIEGEYPLRASNLEYLNSSTIKRVDMASFLKFPKDEVCGGKMYKCVASTKNNSYDKTIYVDKCPSTELPVIIYWPNSFILKYWVKTLVVEEGSNIMLRCIYHDHRFDGNNIWYKGNETINFDERISLNKLDNVLSISNLKLNDTGAYRCVSSENEFFTSLVVIKNYKGKPRKTVYIIIIQYCEFVIS